MTKLIFGETSSFFMKTSEYIILDHFMQSTTMSWFILGIGNIIKFITQKTYCKKVSVYIALAYIALLC